MVDSVLTANEAMIGTLLWSLIAIQIFMGAFDTLFHHEMTERLAWRPSQKQELKLHAIRNGFYAVAFILLGWTMPSGLLAITLMLLLVCEVFITLWDFVEEDRSRALPASERVTHTLLALNYGAILVLLWPVLMMWSTMPTGLTNVTYGWWSVMCSLAALGVTVFGMRDWLASARLDRIKIDPAYQLATSLSGRKTILVTGATGFVGSRLVAALKEAGHDVIVLTRNEQKALKLGAPLRVITSLDQISDFENIDAIVNLAGDPVAGGLWTLKKRARIISSRVSMTAELIKLTGRLVTKPKVMIAASAVGWYGIRGTERLSEQDAAKDCFSHVSCSEVEKAARHIEIFGTRVVRLRIGLVLGTEGGLLARLLLPFEFGVGGPIGTGEQGMSWISRDDLVRLIIYAIANPALAGAVNACAPNPVSNREFSITLGKALNRPAIMSLPATPLEWLAGDFAKELLTGGQYVYPQKAVDSGFIFRDPHLEPTLKTLLGHKISKLTVRGPIQKRYKEDYEIVT